MEELKLREVKSFVPADPDDEQQSQYLSAPPQPRHFAPVAVVLIAAAFQTSTRAKLRLRVQRGLTGVGVGGRQQSGRGRHARKMKSRDGEPGMP